MELLLEIEELWYHTGPSHRQAAHHRHLDRTSNDQIRCRQILSRTTYPDGQSKGDRNGQFAYDTLVVHKVRLLPGGNCTGTRIQIFPETEMDDRKNPMSQKMEVSSDIGTGQLQGGNRCRDLGRELGIRVLESSQHGQNSIFGAAGPFPRFLSGAYSPFVQSHHSARSNQPPVDDHQTGLESASVVQAVPLITG
jgi:hypothetical protein